MVLLYYIARKPYTIFKSLILVISLLQSGPKKDFLRVDNFVTANGKKVCDMSEDSEFLLEKSIQLACECI